MCKKLKIFLFLFSGFCYISIIVQFLKFGCVDHVVVKVKVRGRAGCLVLEVIFAECPEEEANASQTKPL